MKNNPTIQEETGSFSLLSACFLFDLCLYLKDTQIQAHCEISLLSTRTHSHSSSQTDRRTDRVLKVGHISMGQENNNRNINSALSESSHCLVCTNVITQREAGIHIAVFRPRASRLLFFLFLWNGSIRRHRQVNILLWGCECVYMCEDGGGEVKGLVFCPSGYARLH